MKNMTFALAAALVAASPVAAQVSQPGERDDTPAAKDTSLDQGLADFERKRVEARGNDRVSRTALERWAECIAHKNTGEATRILSMDFKAPAYDRALRMLAQEDRSCIGFRGSLRSAGLLFAGEMAEALLEADAKPLVNRLARAASGEPTKAFSFTDGVAICVVRSVPNDVASLFATARDSAEETASLSALATPMALCAKAAQARKQLSVNPAGLRAMLATASFRSIASAKVS